MSEPVLKNLAIDQIRPSPFQPRQSFPKDSIEELAQSIKERGLIEPIVVRPDGATYQIVTGERRWRAHQLAGLTQILSIIRKLSDIEAMEISLIENLQREDLMPSEEQKMFYDLWKIGRGEGRYENYQDMAKKLGIGKNPRSGGKQIANRVHAWEDKQSLKDKYTVPLETPTTVMAETRGLDKEDRVRVIRMAETGEVPKHIGTFRTLVRMVKDAPEPVKKALLKPESRITPEVAKQILKLPEEAQEAAIQEVEAYRLDEEDALEYVTRIVTPPELPKPTPEQVEKIHERMDASSKKTKAWKKLPETEAVKQKFQNLMYHTRAIQAFGMPSEGIVSPMVCPKCGSKELGWMCHNLPLEESLELVKQQHKDAVAALKQAEITDEEYQEAVKELEEIA